VGTPRNLFESPALADPAYSANYDVSHDGQEFITIEPIGEPTPPVIRVVQNWFEEFRDQQAGSE